MPSIIAAPIRTRNDSRGVTEAQATEYVDAMHECAIGEIVLVDDSASDGYEKSYAKGERIRTAIHKYDLMEKGTVQVIAWDAGDGEFVSGMRLKA